MLRIQSIFSRERRVALRIGLAVVSVMVLVTLGSVPAWAGFVNGIEVTGGSTPTPSVAQSKPFNPVKPSGLTSGTDIYIDFDSLPAPCGFIETLALRNAYAALGVLFDHPDSKNGGAILDQCGNFSVSGYSPLNFLGFNCEAATSDGGRPTGPEIITFNPPVSSVTVLVAEPSNADPGAQTLTIEAYDAASELLDRDSVTLTGVLQPLQVSSGQGISSVRIGTAQPCVWVLDNLHATRETAIPTLSQWGAAIFGALLLSSVLFYMWRRRRTAVVFARRQ